MLKFAGMILFHEKVDQTIECIKSLLPSGISIYILNNNSSADSRARLGEFCRAHENVRILDSDVNLGVGVGRNYLLSHTSEEWLLFMDNDIVVKTSDWLDRVCAHILESPETEVFIPRLYNVHENRYVTYNGFRIVDNHVLHYPLTGDSTNVFPGGASFVKRAIFDRLGYYDDKMFIELEDFDMAIRGLRQNEPVRARLVMDIEMIHDHRVASSVCDKKAVLGRYNMSNGEKSLRRISEKYPGLVFAHEWRGWVADQVSNLLSKDIVDLSLATPAKNFGCKAKARVLAQLCCVDTPKQTQVYARSLAAAKAMGAHRVVNFGCGSGEGFVKAFMDMAVELVGIDNGDAIKIAQDTLPSGKWISALFDDYAVLEEIFASLKSSGAQLFILTGVIERLEDPRALLRTLRRLLLLNPANRMLISTPDRAANDNAEAVSGECNVREWTMEELTSFLKASGFAVRDSAQVTPDPDRQERHLLVTAGLIMEEYEIFLSANYLPGPELEYLIFTEEHGKAKLTGGIGAYVEEMQKLFPEKILGICLMGKGDLLPDPLVIKQEKMIVPACFFDALYDGGVENNELAAELLEQIVYLYHGLRLAESQDIAAYGFRFAAARHSGLIPPMMATKICCHGTRIYLENNNKIWHASSTFLLMDKERIGIEKSDIVSCPTDFIRRLGLDAGYRFVPDRTHKQRLAFTFTQARLQPEYVEVDTVIYFGKRVIFKGYAAFTRAVDILCAEGHIGNAIKKIILLGPKAKQMEECNIFFDSIKGRVEVVETSLSRADALALITQSARNALCVMPYPNDNHPYSVLEAISTGCQILAARAGGIPELLPERFHGSVLCEPTGEGIAEGIRRVLSLSGQKRGELISGLLDAVSKEQENINSLNRDSLIKLDEFFPVQPRKPRPGTAVVIAAVSVESLGFIKDLVYALNQQTVRPRRVIFALYGKGISKEGVILLLTGLVLPYEVIGGGLVSNGAAKNLALGIADADYAINIKPGSIPKRDLVARYISYLDNAPDDSAVTSFYNIIGKDGDWRNESVAAVTHRPIGDFNMLLGQLENRFGHANSGFRVAALRAAGGWDESSGPEVNEWALFLKLKSNNKNIGVVPRVLALCRDEDNAIADDYPAQRSLARSTESLPKYDAFRLQGVMRDYYEKNIKLDAYYWQLKGNDRQLAEQDMQLAEKDHQMAEQRAEMDRQRAEKDCQVALMAVEKEAVLQSWSWRITAPLRKIFEIFMPKRHME